jgi:asparagine synthase (glutamine-hydrolysing)
MCGIVGVLAPNVHDPLAIVRPMAGIIEHRGPDDEGFTSDGRFAMGMRRLSIIDLDGGHQPITNDSGQLSIVFNGEIYNYRELRDCLTGLGHRFRTRSDTEVILRAFEQYGPACVRRLNGMFAFAIWDSEKQELFLARDHMGVKPLYYAMNGVGFLFGSEIKAIIESRIVSRRINPEALWHYLSFRYVPEHTCIWEGVSKLPPGHTLTLGRDLKPRIERYWDIPRDPPSDVLDATEDAAQFGALFEDAVRMRLIADVPVGILLSGGLDSSAVAAAVNRVHDAPVRAFSVAFHDGGDADESRYARLVADHLKAPYEEIRIGQQEFEEWMPEFVWHSDEPLADSASVPLFFVSRLASNHVKVVLSGEGSDELMAGYDFLQSLKDLARITDQARSGRAALRFFPPPVRKIVKRAVRGNRLERLFLEPGDELRWMSPNMTSAFTSMEKRALWEDAPPLEDSLDVVRRTYDRASRHSPLAAMLYVYSQDWLVEDLLMKADKMTMAASIELRVPFLDYRLVEWLASRPASSKLRLDAAGPTTKVLLRNYAATHLPPEIINRPKIGFQTPVMSWVRKDSNGFASRLLRDRNGWVRSMFNGAAIDRLLQRAATDQRAAVQVWHLLVLEHWGRRWM